MGKSWRFVVVLFPEVVNSRHWRTFDPRVTSWAVERHLWNVLWRNGCGKFENLWWFGGTGVDSFDLHSYLYPLADFVLGWFGGGYGPPSSKLAGS